jgi:hypothetical protein
MLKLGEYFYQLPRMTESFQDLNTVKTVVIASAVASGVAWAAPSLKWHKTA